MREHGENDRQTQTDKLAQDIAIKAAQEIATQAEFAAIDAGHRESLREAAKRFDAIRHYAERALEALNRASRNSGHPDSVQ